MNEIQIRERLQCFSGPIEEIAINNAAVHRIIKEYVYGRIVTKEEALSQMVVALATDWSDEAERSFWMTMGVGFTMPKGTRGSIGDVGIVNADFN